MCPAAGLYAWQRRATSIRETVEAATADAGNKVQPVVQNSAQHYR